MAFRDLIDNYEAQIQKIQLEIDIAQDPNSDPRYKEISLEQKETAQRLDALMRTFNSMNAAERLEYDHQLSSLTAKYAAQTQLLQTRRDTIFEEIQVKQTRIANLQEVINKAKGIAPMVRPLLGARTLREVTGDRDSLFNGRSPYVVNEHPMIPQDSFERMRMMEDW